MADMAKIVLTSDTRGLKKGETAMTSFARKGEQTERRVKKSATAMAGSMNALSASAVRMAAVAGAAIGAFLGGKLFLGAIREQEQLQRNMLKTQSIIEATGGAAERTADQLLEQARGLARATLLSTEGIMAAQQVMLTFRHVTGDTFDRAIEAAADMSEAIGTDLKSSVLQLGKALEDPVTGMTALTRSGTVFTIEQKAMVKAMVEAGNAAEAQNFILGELEKQYGGVARAAGQGLGGVMDDLTQSWQEFRIAIADILHLGVASTSVIGGLSSTLMNLTAGMESITSATKKAWEASTTFKASVIAIAGAIGASLIPVVLRLTTALVGLALAHPFTAIILGLVVATTAIVAFVGKVGGVGAAFDLLKDVAVEAWDRIGDKFEEIGFRFKALTLRMKAVWLDFITFISGKWGDFVTAIAPSINKMSAVVQSEFRVSNVAILTLASGLENAASNTRRFADEAESSADALAKLGDKPLTSVEALVEAVADVATETETTTTAIAGAGGLVPAVETLADKMRTELVSAIDGVSNAFGDWMKRGFTDFKSFAGSILSTFKTMLINMIAMAAKNKIMISLGLGGSAVGTAASAAGTGMLGTAIGGFGAAGVAGTGLLGGLGAVGAGTAAGFASGGIGGALSGFAGSTAAGISGGIAAGGVAGIGAAIGAALPIIGIGLALFSLFKKKPPYTEKDFNAIQAAIELTNTELLNTNTAGQKAATALKDAFGGLENMQRATESYYNNFFSNEEKRLRAIEGIDGVFASLGIAVPTTATAFRDIVEAQDLMTSEGRDTYSALLQVSDAFAQVYGGVNDVTDALMALNASVGGSIFSTLVDERRAAAYQRNGIAFDVDQPERAGGGIAYRGTGPRITTTAQAEADKLAESLAEQSDAQTSLLIDIQKSTTRTLRIYDSWDVVGLPPERT